MTINTNAQGVVDCTEMDEIELSVQREKIDNSQVGNTLSRNYGESPPEPSTGIQMSVVEISG